MKSIVNFTCLWKDTHVKKKKTLKLNHRDHWQHSEKVRLLTAQQNGLKFPALVGYCAFWGLCMFVFLVAGLQLLLKTSGAPSCPVCTGLMPRQEAWEQPTPLYCSSPSQQHNNPRLVYTPFPSQLWNISFKGKDLMRHWGSSHSSCCSHLQH